MSAYGYKQTSRGQLANVRFTPSPCRKLGSTCNAPWRNGMPVCRVPTLDIVVGRLPTPQPIQYTFLKAILQYPHHGGSTVL